MNNKRFYAAAVLACMVMLSQSANAAKGFKYSYGEFGGQYVNAQSGDGGGFNIGFSFAATDYVNVLGEYNRIFGIDGIEELAGFKDPTNVSVERDEFKFGLGVHYPFTDKFDMTFSTKYVDQEYSGKWSIPPFSPAKTNLSNSEEGYEAELGARVKIGKKFEMTPHVIHREIGDNSNSGGGLGFVYKFYKKFSFRAKGTFYADDSESNAFLGLRLNL